MSGNKKTAPRTGTTRGGENLKTDPVLKSPCFNSTTPRDQSQHCLEKILPRGAENAVSVSALSHILGVPERKVRDLAASERAQGVPIIARSSGGYYLAPPTPEGINELAAFVRRLRAVGVETIKTAAALEQCVVELGGQLSIEEISDGERKT